LKCIVSSTSAPSSGRSAGEVFLVPHHHLAMPTFFGLLHRLQQQLVRLGAFGLGRDVVGAIEEERIDLVELDEILDLDRLGALRAPRLPALPGGRRRSGPSRSRSP
jgi:hypothetical protein